MSTGAMWAYVETICDKLRRSINLVASAMFSASPANLNWKCQELETKVASTTRLVHDGVFDAIDSAMFPLHKMPRMTFTTTATFNLQPQLWRFVTVAAPVEFTTTHTPGQAPEVQRQ